MSRCVLLAINAKYVHSSLAAWYLAAGVSAYCAEKHDFSVLEHTINEPPSNIVSEVLAKTPEVLGISVYIWNAGMVPQIMAAVRGAVPDIKIVLGGPEAANNPEYWLQSGADFVAMGEGEHVLPLLLDRLERQGKTDEVSGFYRMGEDGALCAAAPADMPPEEPSAALPDPYTDKYYASLGDRLAYVETSRGCPFGCTYCLSSGSNTRFFPLEMSKDRIYRLAQGNRRTIKFVDRTFNCNCERAYAMFSYVIGLDTECCFHFEVAADLFDPKTTALLNTAAPGRVQLEIGLQSFNEPTLKVVNRQTDLEICERNIRALLAPGNIHVHIDLIAGLPLEGLESLKKSFARAFALRPHTLQLGFLKLLHGSELRKNAARFSIEYSPEPPYEVISTRWISAEELDEVRQVEDALDTLYNSGRFLYMVDYLLEASGLEPYALFEHIGRNVPWRGDGLTDHAGRVYACCATLEGVCPELLCDAMTLDWLSFARGKNMPAAIKAGADSAAFNAARKLAEDTLGRAIERSQVCVLSDGRVAFIEEGQKDPVTKRYKLYLDLQL